MKKLREFARRNLKALAAKTDLLSMQGGLATETLVVNTAIDLRIGDAVFVALLAAFDGDTSVVMMDGFVRSGTVVTLTQGLSQIFGRVQSCRTLEEGGFELLVAPLEQHGVWTDEFEWSSAALCTAEESRT